MSNWNMGISKITENSVILEHLSTSSLIKIETIEDKETIYLDYREIEDLIKIINTLQEK